MVDLGLRGAMDDEGNRFAEAELRAAIQRREGHSLQFEGHDEDVAGAARSGAGVAHHRSRPTVRKTER